MRILFSRIGKKSLRNKLVLINCKLHLDEAEPVELGHKVSFQLVHGPPLLGLEGGN